MKEAIGTGKSTGSYYRSFNSVYEETFGKPLSLHFPYFIKENETLEERIINLSIYLFAYIDDWKGKTVLEVGCGNGVQSIYLANNYPICNVTGIDVNEDNLDVANRLGEENPKVEFKLDNAQELSTIESNSIDILFCIESALHYPDKLLFLKQVHRVLKPDGKFIIADILNRSKRKIVFLRRWGRRMAFYHWILPEYLYGFDVALLKLTQKKDITDSIIKGFSGYREWVRKEQFIKRRRYVTMKIFTFIQCEIYIIMMKRRRSYLLFSGSKMQH